MTRIKEDLICEIIRLSQTNLLSRKKAEGINGNGEQIVLDWINKNAKGYRNRNGARLGSFSASELAEMLQELKGSKKDLDEILETSSPTISQGKPSGN